MVNGSRIKLMVCGSRSITDADWVKAEIGSFWYNEIAWVDKCIMVEGEARGVDTYAKEYAQENQWTIESYPANWEKFGKSAGYIRNEEMVKACDVCLIIWDGQSLGTKHDIDLCIKHNKPYRILIYNDTVKERYYDKYAGRPLNLEVIYG